MKGRKAGGGFKDERKGHRKGKKSWQVERGQRERVGGWNEE